ncbi:MAG: endonuclease [Bacteroidales bacterium]|nr:endonuclease [Lentimicrobiaceae bacterium]MDD5693989.1 endonuclease [Bacteroidales bacterium]
MNKNSSINTNHILFYNVENLFDTKDDPKTLDNEYLPSSAKKWDKTRYSTKINHIAKVISSACGDFPVIVGLTEIENDTVLTDLITANRLKPGNYGFIHYDSKDERGMDVAMLYRKDYFTPLFSQPISLTFPFDRDDTTRDVLYVKGVFQGRDTVHLFVNHWPSRREGVMASEPRRVHAARTVRQFINGIFFEDPEARILIMGDFNDPPESYSLKKILLAVPTGKAGNLYNLAFPMFRKRSGTINHRGRWLLFDQIIVSRSILDPDSSIHIPPGSFRILDAPWLMFNHPKFHEKMPNKTYSGDEYHGGYSDHLPVYVTIVLGGS